MKFVINTNYKAAGTIILDGIIERLKNSGNSVTRNDWVNYSNYDFVIFTAPDSKIKEAKMANPKIICGLFDPKLTLSRQINEAKASDFLIVSSLEQREAFLKYNKNIFIYYMFPDIPEIKKEHLKKDKIIIGYHGNKQHLDAMSDASKALDILAKDHDIEFWAIYNFQKLGKWRMNAPKVCPIRYIQWSQETFTDDLSRCDIGIAPAAIPAPKLFARPLFSFLYNPIAYNKNDYLQRFKMSNNPGRIYVFSQLHVPVVADFTPSACEIIKDNYSGMLVGSKEGWVEALKKLIKDAELRNTISSNLNKYIDENCSTEINFNNFMIFLNSIYANRQ